MEIRRVLIANRGEIAVRVCRTLHELGKEAVAVYSEVDESSPHVVAAHRAYALKGRTAAESYLDIEQLLDVARRSGADAVHPGYGFLSENAAFAARCRDAGLVFIGPPPEVIAAMGNKMHAKATMQAAGVPVAPSVTAADDWSEAARRLGYPVLVKAASGGGGKGMRRVSSPEHLQDAVDAASREARSAFGDATVFMEKYLERPRHVEFQIFGDHHGHAVHLFERECSVQRRHQKVLEESPSVALDDDLRRRMGEAAVAAARAIGYRNAGTVEFLVDAERNFYFLEVNTRLQVEHPVTEMRLGMDLVALQLSIAEGQPLPFSQADLQPRGHAMEVRLYAEVPEEGFLPSTGVLRRHDPPHAPWVRVDAGVAEGTEISIYYDPMLSKLIVWAPHREGAIRRMQAALSKYIVLGVRHNIDFLQRLLKHPALLAGDLHTHFLDDHAELLQAPSGPLPAGVVAAALSGNGTTEPSRVAVEHPSPWAAGGRWRGL